MANRKGLIAFLLALLVAPFSFAAGIGDLFDRHGFAIYPATGAVSVQTNATINATAANGTRAVVPVSAAVHVPKSVLVANAVKVARAGSAIGIAWTAWDTYNAIKDSGITVCPAPDFFCSPGEAGGPLYQVQYRYCEQSTLCSYWRTDIKQACDDWAIAANTGRTDGITWRISRYPNVSAGDQTCGMTASDGSLASAVPKGYLCTNGGSLISTTPPTCGTSSGQPSPVTEAGPPKPMSDAEFQSALTAKVDAGVQPSPGMADSGWNSSMYKKLWDAVAKDAAARAASMPVGIVPLTSRVGSNSLIFASGPPVVTPETTTKTRVVTNPDGTTSTEVTKEKTTFTPDKTGTTVSDGQIIAKPTTTVTTSTTNNTTNQTTTSTETLTPPGGASEKPTETAINFCKENPDVLACKMMGTPIEATPVPDKQVAVAIAADDGWGMSDAACPPPGQITALGKTIDVPWDMFCRFAHGIRPFLIAFAYMAAIGGFLGLSRGN